VVRKVVHYGHGAGANVHFVVEVPVHGGRTNIFGLFNIYDLLLNHIIIDCMKVSDGTTIWKAIFKSH
jgi:hypothetical protein